MCFIYLPLADPGIWELFFRRVSSCCAFCSLVFSQSLFSLNLIEEHLDRLHKDMQRCRNSDKEHPSHVYFGTWKEDYDYFRLDGSTSEERRQLMCDRINKASNERWAMAAGSLAGPG